MNPSNDSNAQGSTRRDLVKKLGKAAYIAPATIAILTSSKASACA